jgi:hypothetical protein
MKGALIHGFLLLGMLAVAYQTWTRDTSVKATTGNVVVWNEKASALQAIVYQNKDKTLRLESKDGYWWGTETTTKKKPKPQPPATGDAGVPPPEFETVTTTTEFPVDATAVMPLVSGYSAMRAVRNLGPLDDTQKVDYELKCGSDKFKCPEAGATGSEDSEKTVSLVFAGGTHTVMLGGNALGGQDRYGLDVDTGTGYVLAAALLTPLDGGMRALQPKQAMPTGDTVQTISIATPDGKSKSVSRVTVTDEEGKTAKTWGDKATGKGDQTTANFLTKVETSAKPTKYDTTLDVKTLTKLVTVTYQDAGGKTLGTLDLYKRTTDAPAPPTPPEGTPPPPAPQPVVEYYVVSEMTRVPAQITKTAGDQIEQNIATVFTE